MSLNQDSCCNEHVSPAKDVRTAKNKLIAAPRQTPSQFNPIDIRKQPSILGKDWYGVYQHDVDFGATHFEKAMANILLEPNINSTLIMRTDVISDTLADKEYTKSWLKQRGISVSDDDFTLKYRNYQKMKKNVSIPTIKNGESSSSRPKKQTTQEPVQPLDDYQLLNLAIPENVSIDKTTMPLSHYLEDTEARHVDTELVSLERSLVRRIVPRKPLRDPVINQTCAIHTRRIDKSLSTEKASQQNSDRETTLPTTDQDSVLVTYIPHIKSPAECPFYLPPAKAVGILYHNYTISVHYQLYDEDRNSEVPFAELPDSDRMIRIALHLLETPYKHSFGAKAGYKKRVYHDVVVPKVDFQNQYIHLKAKYSKEFVSNWVESTDPKKHVFEDIAIAAFIIELWSRIYHNSKDTFTFVDVGCGNGLLVNILIQEGYKGYGIDARARKSWATYPEHVQKHLKEQVIIPKILIDETPLRTYQAEGDSTVHKYKDLLQNPAVNTAEFPENTFLIGNHSDELTVWLPLFCCPFIVIPCCSYSLNGTRTRYTPKNANSKSTYASLVDHVEEVAQKIGWVVEKEVLRIPSTRNTALIGKTRLITPSNKTVREVLYEEGGGDGWIERVTALQTKNPRNH